MSLMIVFWFLRQALCLSYGGLIREAFPYSGSALSRLRHTPRHALAGLRRLYNSFRFCQRMYKLKQVPEDFKVIERTIVTPSDSGSYVYMWLTKRLYNTVRACEAVADFFGVQRKEVGFAGSKDHDAVTRQLISIRDFHESIGKKRVLDFKQRDLLLEWFGRGNSPISLGDLAGNEFEIVVRDVSSDKIVAKPNFFVNYFDEQRFSERNHVVGKLMIKGEFGKAADLISHDLVQEYRARNPPDAVGALRRLSIKEQLLYIHAYQSWLWNETVRRYIRMMYPENKIHCVTTPIGKLVFVKALQKKDNSAIPLVGFATEYHDATIKGIILALLEEEGVSERDFVIRSLPDLSSEGASRSLLANVEEFKLEKIEKTTWKVSFFLPKGSYATMLIKQLFS